MNSSQIPIVSVTPHLKLLYTSMIDIAEPQMLGQTPYGERRIINITGGTFEGDRLSGKILPGGADWQIIRHDAVAEVEARYTLQTYDGDLIYITNWGYRHGPASVIKRLSAGESVDPAEYYFRTVPKFETASAEYAWLNSAVCIAAGERRVNQVIISVYEVL